MDRNLFILAVELYEKHAIIKNEPHTYLPAAFFRIAEPFDRRAYFAVKAEQQDDELAMLDAIAKCPNIDSASVSLHIERLERLRENRAKHARRTALTSVK